MTTKSKIIFSTLAVATVTATVVAFNSNDALKLKANSNQYTCASIHFGMRDSDCTAMTYSASTSSTSLNTRCDVGGVTVSNVTFENVYNGGAYSNANTNYSNYAWKLGGSKKKPVFTVELEEQIIGATIYVLGFGTDPVVITVNGQEYTPTTFQASVEKANAVVCTYESAYFSFESTNTLTISTKRASKTVSGKSVSACRFYLADISFRVAN